MALTLESCRPFSHEKIVELRKILVHEVSLEVEIVSDSLQSWMINLPANQEKFVIFPFDFSRNL